MNVSEQKRKTVEKLLREINIQYENAKLFKDPKRIAHYMHRHNEITKEMMKLNMLDSYQRVENEKI